MFVYMLASILIVLAIGAVVRHWLNAEHAGEFTPITTREFVWSSFVIAALIVPITVTTGWQISKRNQLTYTELLSGWERSAEHFARKCVRDGTCQNTYSCDPYIVMVPYTYSCGKSICTGVRPQTRYHSCPYAREEWDFSVRTTLGQFDIDHGRFPAGPQAYRWREGVNIPESVLRSAGVGYPKPWLEVQRRVLGDSAGPVHKWHRYDNYVLASQVTVLRSRTKDLVERYLRDTLLPDITREISSYYRLNPVYSVRGAGSSAFWVPAERLAAGMGHALAGDFRLVLVPSTLDPDEYKLALQAYWQNREYQGRQALPKNVLVLVAGTDGTTVRWSRAFTGMPSGNEQLLDELEHSLTGRPLHPDTLLGSTSYIVGKNQTLFKESVVAPRIQQQFKRQSMGVYEYLKGDIQPTKTAKIFSVLLAITFGSLFWLVPIWLHCPTDDVRRHYFRW